MQLHALVLNVEAFNMLLGILESPVRWSGGTKTTVTDAGIIATIGATVNKHAGFSVHEVIGVGARRIPGKLRHCV